MGYVKVIAILKPKFSLTLHLFSYVGNQGLSFELE